MTSSKSAALQAKATSKVAKNTPKALKTLETPKDQKPSMAARALKIECGLSMARAALAGSGQSMRSISRETNVNRSTLNRRMKGGVSHIEASADNQYLTTAQELLIVELLQKVFVGACPALGKQALRKLAQTAINKSTPSPGKKHSHVSESWENRLRSRHAVLGSFKRVQSHYSDKGNVFQTEHASMHKTLEQYNVSKKHFYSFGELSLFSLNGQTIDSVGTDAEYREGFLDVFATATGAKVTQKAQATVFEAVNSLGQVLPSYVVFNGPVDTKLISFDGHAQSLPIDLSTDIDQAFLAWLKFFYLQTGGDANQSYRALYLQVHYFLLSVDVLAFAASHKILFFACLPHRQNVAPCYQVTEYMKRTIMAEGPPTNPTDMLKSIEYAKSFVSPKDTISAWEDSSLFADSANFELVAKRGKSPTTLQYRKQYMKAYQKAVLASFKSQSVKPDCQLCTGASQWGSRQVASLLDTDKDVVPLLVNVVNKAKTSYVYKDKLEKLAQHVVQMGFALTVCKQVVVQCELATSEYAEQVYTDRYGKEEVKVEVHIKSEPVEDMPVEIEQPRPDFAEPLDCLDFSSSPVAYSDISDYLLPSPFVDGSFDVSYDGSYNGSGDDIYDGSYDGSVDDSMTWLDSNYSSTDGELFSIDATLCSSPLGADEYLLTNYGK